ncbi:MAG: TspO/MBR family protein [Vicinamibacterales bacterium]
MNGARATAAPVSPGHGRPRSWLWLVGFIGVCQLVGIVAALGTSTDTVWYDQLAKPDWNPPRWVFAPVWTTLYALMGIAAWRVWRTGRGAPALRLFFMQLALNFAWSFLFFGAQAIVAALIEIVVLWIAIVVTTAAFWRLDRPAAWLMAPYLAWVSFATALNGAIVLMN